MKKNSISVLVHDAKSTTIRGVVFSLEISLCEGEPSIKPAPNSTSMLNILIILWLHNQCADSNKSKRKLGYFKNADPLIIVCG